MELDAEFSAGITYDIGKLLLSTTKRFKISELSTVVTQEKYPHLHKFINEIKRPSTPPSSITNPINPKKLRVKPSIDIWFSNFGSMLVELNNCINKENLKILFQLYEKTKDKYGTQEKLTNALELFDFMKQRCDLDENKLDILHDLLSQLDNGPMLLAIIYKYCKIKT